MMQKPHSPGESSTSSDHASLNAKPITTLLCLGKKEKCFFDEFEDDLLFNHRPVLVKIDVNRGQARCAHLKKNTFCECPQIYLVKKIHFSWVSSNLASVDSLTSSVLLPGPPPLSLNSWPVEKTEMPMLCDRANCTEAWIASCTHKIHEFLGWMFWFPTLTVLSSS